MCKWRVEESLHEFHECHELEEKNFIREFTLIDANEEKKFFRESHTNRRRRIMFANGPGKARVNANGREWKK